MVGPEIGLSMLYRLGEPFEKMVEQIPKEQVSCIEIVDDGLHSLTKRRVSALKNLEESYDLKYTVHAPFAGVNISLPSEPMLNATLRVLKKSIIHAGELNCRIWVFHPGLRNAISMFYPGMDWIRNLESVRVLIDFARDHGVEVAIENVMEPFVLKSVEEFKRFYEEVDEDVGLVLDTGHANLIGQVQNFFTSLPDRIVHIHAHDNDGKYDKHLGIGYGNIDWKAFADQLRRTSFRRIVIIESMEHVQESLQRLRQLIT
jgi:sugar phosphate isomerase/epimerase